MITKLQLPILPTNPESLNGIRQKQYNQELTLSDNRNYILLTTCLFEAIVRDYSSQLLPRDIIFLLQLLNLYSAALNKKQKTIIYSSEKLAKLLGYKAKDKNNMRSIVLRKVKKLEQLGLLNVTRHKDKKGSDKVNEIVPILPDCLYDKIKYEPSNFNVDSILLKGESNIQHILRTKLFVPIDLEFIKSLFDDARMSDTHKLFFLNCIINAYKNYQTTGKLSFAATSKELISKNNVSKRTLFNILGFIKNQYPDYFIEVKHSYSKSDDIDSNKYDKSIFVISINPIVFPKFFLNTNNVTVSEEITGIEETMRTDSKSLVTETEIQKPDTYDGFQAGVQKWKPSSAKKAAHNNKEIIIKESNKNIDVNHAGFAENNQINPPTFLQISSSEHLESEQSSLSSKSLKHSIKDFIDALPPPSNATCTNASSTIQDISDKKNKINIKNNFDILTSTKTSSQPKARNDRQHKDFRYFYPISEKDANMLNFKANREFDTNFTNQLLLKLYIKYPEKRFKNKFTFSDYMIKTLTGENHQAPQVNNPSFRFSCNIGKEEKNLLEYERYLSQIENSFDTSKEMCVKKKIAGRFSSEVAYKILTKVEFKLNHDNSFITALIPSSLALSERQIEILSQQLEAVYGINRYYVQDVDNVGSSEDGIDTGEKAREAKLGMIYPKTAKSAIVTNSEVVGILASSRDIDTIKENTVWHQIRKGLIEELGESIDAVWFSKAVATEDKEQKTLTLTMPTRFMSDWVRNNYSHVIRMLASSVGVKIVEYLYE